MENARKIWLVVAVLLSSQYFIVSPTPESKLALFDGVALLAVSVMLVAATRKPVSQRASWTLLAAGVGAFLLGDVAYYFLQQRAENGYPAFPSIADAFYLAMYPALAAGLLTRHRLHADPGQGQIPVAALVVSGALGAAALITFWPLFIDEILAGPSTGVAQLIQLAYPVMDAALIAVAAFVLFTARTRTTQNALILVATLALALGDIIYNVQLTNGTFRTASWPDLLWLSFIILLATAALTPPQPTNTDTTTPTKTHHLTPA